MDEKMSLSHEQVTIRLAGTTKISIHGFNIMFALAMFNRQDNTAMRWMMIETTGQH